VSGEYSVEAVVLESRKLGENDRLATLLTRRHGKLRLVVRGAAKPRSKLAAVTQPFDCVRLDVWRGRTLDGVKGGEVLHSLRRLRSEPKALGCAYCLAEIVSYLGQEGEADEPLYLLLLTCLRALSAGVLELLVVVFFIIRASRVSGFYPVLDQCVRCAGELEDESYLCFGHGGALCRLCAGDVRGDGASMTACERELAGNLARVHPRNLLEYEEDEDRLRSMLGLFLNYLEYQLERRVNSRYFMDMLE